MELLNNVGNDQIMKFTLSAISWYYIKKQIGSNLASTLHAGLMVLFCLLIKYFQLNFEYSVLLADFAVGYFLIDCFNTKRKDFIAHHVAAIYFTYITLQPEYNSYGILESGYLLEFSTPFLNQTKRASSDDHKKIWGLLFIVTFFFARIIWLPYFLYEIKELMPFYLATIAFSFVLLNYYWFYTILKIAAKKI